MARPSRQSLFSPLLLVSFLFSYLSYGQTPPQAKPLDKLVGKLQKVWDETTSYEAKFKQHIFSKQIGTHDENEGVISVQKPNKIRWDSKTEGSVQIISGKKLTFIQTNRRRGTTTVDVYNDISKKVDVAPLRFLGGSIKFRDTYTISLLKENEKMLSMRLAPKGKSTETYIAEFDRQSYLLLSLTTETAETRARIDFLETKINALLDKQLFEYKPKPTDVVQVFE